MEATSERRASGELTPACRCDVTRRGPNWLFVHVETVGMGCGLADRLWELADRQFTYRVVLDFDDTRPVDPNLGLEVGRLHRQLERQGGALRLCGLTPAAAQAVLAEAACPGLHNHQSDRDAIFGGPPCDGESTAAADA